MKTRFADIKRTRRGEPIDPSVNILARKTAEGIGDVDLLKLFDEAVDKRWYGELLFQMSTALVYEFKFRHGVCQFYKAPIQRGKAVFLLNVINNNVDFRGDGSNEGN